MQCVPLPSLVLVYKDLIISTIVDNRTKYSLLRSL